MKYGFSPLELRLAKDKCRFSVVLNHLVLANNIYRNRLGDIDSPDNLVYPLYAVLNELPLDDAQLMCLPYFVDLLSVINQIYPVSFVERRHTLMDEDGYLQRLHQINRSQVAIFQELVKRQELPWTLQCFFLNKMCRVPDTFQSDERNNIAAELSSCLTYPYLKNKLMRLDSVERRSTDSACVPFDRDSMLSACLGKYVHIVCLSSKATDMKFCTSSPGVENLLIDFKDNPDLQIVFIFNGQEYSEEQYNDVVSVLPQGSHCIRMDFEHYLEIQKSFCFMGSLKQVTLDRRGGKLSIPLDMNHESAFRQRIRNILKLEEK